MALVPPDASLQGATHLPPADLVAAAVAARRHAYAPHSRYHVGAALRVLDGRTFVGVNVENASYGLTVCAERNAVGAAAAAGVVPGELVAVAVVAEGAASTVTPCGACRQVLANWAAPTVPVFAHALPSGETTRHTVGGLLPGAFVLAETGQG